MAEKETSNGDVTMSILEHLEELRSRLIKILISAGAGFCIGYYFSETIFGYLIRPLTNVLPKGTSLIFTSITEAFFTYLKVGLLAGVFIASPFILYQIWAFISPGLYKKERRALIPVTFISVILFIGGACFGYFVVFPFGFKFLISTYTTEMIKPMPTMREYFSLVTWMLLAFGAIFELPVIIFLLSRFGIVGYKGLRKFRRYAIPRCVHPGCDTDAHPGRLQSGDDGGPPDCPLRDQHLGSILLRKKTGAAPRRSRGYDGPCRKRG